MALHEVKNISEITSVNDYYRKMLIEFSESDMVAAEMDIPEGVAMSNSRTSLYHQINKLGLKNKIGIKTSSGRIYLVRKDLFS